jgi:proteasome beta subunit
MLNRTSPKTFADLVGFPNCLRTPVGGPGEAHGTTVLALRFRDGILNLADRRATSANYVMYDRAEKVFALDEYTLMAVSGSFARSVEIARYLRHAFKYYARNQLQELSLEGKLHEVSRALAGNLPVTMEGIGLFLPLVSAYDESKEEFGIYFYDAMGARFESGAFGAAGSGAERIRGVFDYVVRTKGPFEERSLGEVLREGLTMLDIASQLDAATGGLERIPPIARVLTREGISDVDSGELLSAIKEVCGR